MSDFQSMPPIITIAIKEGKRHRDYSHNHNRDMSTYAERLAAARQATGMTQAQLARAAGLKNQSIIGSLESGYRKSTSYTPALANALGVSALWLAEGKGQQTLNDSTEPSELGRAHTAEEKPPSNYLDETTIEARAKILAEQASEVSALWMALPEPRRSTLLTQLRTESQPQAGESRTITPRRARSRAATPGTKGHPATG